MSVAGLNLRDRLEHESIRDGLTDLYNRHFMEISTRPRNAPRREKQ